MIIAKELIPQENDRILCLKVGRVKRENIYEMTRKYWVVNGRRAEKATHVLSIIDGIVDSVFVDCHWQPTQNSQHNGRWEFTARQILDSPYIGKSVKSYYGHSANPVKYINL